jgi:hypothetical protein
LIEENKNMGYENNRMTALLYVGRIINKKEEPILYECY